MEWPNVGAELVSLVRIDGPDGIESHFLQKRNEDVFDVLILFERFDPRAEAGVHLRIILDHEPVDLVIQVDPLERHAHVMVVELPGADVGQVAAGDKFGDIELDRLLRIGRLCQSALKTSQ